VAIDTDFWTGRRVLVTGHTGFKGAWLSLWLQALGADVTGLAPGPPTRPSLYELARVGARMRECAADVRDAEAVRAALRRSAPEIVFHLAAQPMVRRSLRDPAMTYEVNVMGTVNVLEAVRETGAEVRAVVVVTSDKCYENPGVESKRFVESDPLGGDDPYSSSKACAELVTSAYRRSFFADRDSRALRARAPAT
jgi:CDP-glucose 4,6-dehydratase